MPGKLVTVGSFQFLPEAETVRTNLEHEGIRAFVSDAETVNADWFLGNAIGYIKLQVESEQAEAAAAVLEDMRAKQRRHDARALGEIEVPVCLSCGAEFSDTQAICPACGWSFAADENQTEAVEQRDERVRVANPMSSDEGEPIRLLVALRFLKRPFFLILLSPFLVTVSFLVIGGLISLLKAIVR
jgi:hypothetical protein